MVSSCCRHSGLLSIHLKVSGLRIGSGRYGYSIFCRFWSVSMRSSIAMVDPPPPLSEAPAPLLTLLADSARLPGVWKPPTDALPAPLPDTICANDTQQFS